MDNSQNNQQHPYPFNILPDETVFLEFENIPLKITQTTQEISLTLSPLNGKILITNERLVWFVQNGTGLTEMQEQIASSMNQHSTRQGKDVIINNTKGKSIQFGFNDLVSHGLQSQKLLCFLGRDEEQDMEIEEEDNLQQPQQKAQLPIDALFHEIEKQENISDIICVNGSYQLTFDLTNIPAQRQEEIFEQLTKYALEYPQSEDNQEGWGDMITADQIDDQGNLMADKLDNDDSDQDEEEDFNDEEEQKQQ